MFRSRALFAILSTLPVMAVHAQALPKPTPAPVASPAMPAAPAAPAAQPSAFDEIDTNHDGFISREEFLAAQKKRFDTWDTNHDGKVDAKEIASSPPMMERNLTAAERMIKQWDANGDGVVTAEEFQKFSEDRFNKQDKAGTGKIPRPVPPTAMQPQNPQNPKQQTTLKVVPKPTPDTTPQH